MKTNHPSGNEHVHIANYFCIGETGHHHFAQRCVHADGPIALQDANLVDLHRVDRANVLQTFDPCER